MRIYIKSLSANLEEVKTSPSCEGIPQKINGWDVKFRITIGDSLDTEGSIHLNSYNVDIGIIQNVLMDIFNPIENSMKRYSYKKDG